MVQIMSGHFYSILRNVIHLKITAIVV